MTVVGHSYGSLTAGLAARNGAAIDDLAFIGSPGVGVDDVEQLSVPAGHIFVGEAYGDAVADLATFGRDPNTADFGAVNFQTDGGVDPLTGQQLLGSSGHSEYYDLQTESSRNLALITIGRSEEITVGASRGMGDLLVPMIKRLPLP